MPLSPGSDDAYGSTKRLAVIGLSVCQRDSANVTVEVYRLSPEADLGMFSMFGRTGAPTKRGPHKRTGNVG